MSRTLDEAVAKLERDPEHAVTAEVRGMVVELRCQVRRTAADIFKEVGPWEGESQQELTDLVRDGRRNGGSEEPPVF